MRLLRTTGLDRIVITPIIVAGLAAVVAAAASAVVQMLSSLNGTPNGVYIVESAVDLTVPLAFFVAVIQRTLLLRNITALTAQISGGADIGAVRYALRSTLHDPTLEILDLSAPGPDAVGPADEVASGGPVGGQADQAGPVLGEPPADRLVEFIRTEEGTPIAVVIADPALGRYRGLFDAAVQTSGLALKNAQLQAQAAREKLQQVRASRARIVEAGLAERRRIERDLHDGVQQHLLGLAAQLTVAIARAGDEEACEDPGPGQGRAPGGPRRVAGSGSRNPSGRADVRWPGRGAGGCGREAPAAGPGDRSSHPGRYRRGGHRLFRRVRSARQRGEARPGGQRHGYRLRR